MEIEILDEPAIYKYRSFSGDHSREAITRVIKDSELYWQSPTSFNDPFDCLPHFILGDGPRSRRRYAKELVERMRPGSSRNDRRLERKRVESMRPQAARSLARKILSERAITCFTTDPANILMWSHYAADHKGVCFRFQQLGNPFPFVGLDVSYSAERPVADLTRMREDNHDFLKSTVLTKAKCWEYEQELRMISAKSGAGYRKFPAAALTGIILGSAIKSEDEEFTLSLVAEYRPYIEVMRAEMDPRHYRLIIRTV